MMDRLNFFLADKRDHLPSLSHVIGLPEGVTAARPHEREDNSNTPENTSIRHQTSRTSPPATPAPRAPGTEMDYKDKVALTAGDPLKPPTAGETNERTKKCISFSR